MVKILFCIEIRPDYSSRTVYIKPSEPAVLVCALNETIRWRKDGNLITNNEKIKLFQNVLVIRPEEDKDYGEYFCELENYNGKGIHMSLLKFQAKDNSDGEDGSNKFLIPFIVVLILLVVTNFLVVYLLVKRKSTLSTTVKRMPLNPNEYRTDIEMAPYEVPSVSNLGADEESQYAPLERKALEEPVYQGLVFDEHDNDNTSEKDDADYETVESVSKV